MAQHFYDSYEIKVTQWHRTGPILEAEVCKGPDWLDDLTIFTGCCEEDSQMEVSCSGYQGGDKVILVINNQVVCLTRYDGGDSHSKEIGQSTLESLTAGESKLWK